MLLNGKPFGVFVNILKVKLLLVLSLFLTVSCTIGSGSAVISKKTRKSPKLLFKLGMKRLKGGNNEEARAVFKILKAGFPMSMYATTAEIRIADTHKGESHFATAASAYRDFYKDHPRHKMVLSGYAMFMIGYCNYRLGPGDFFIFPPAFEKDLTYTKNAYAVFNVFFNRYPKSIYTKRVRKYYKKSLKLLASHEYYAAEFYLKNKKPKAVKIRYEYLVRTFPDSEIAPKVAVKLTQLYIKDGEFAKATTLSKSILKKYSGTDSAKSALKLLVELKGKRSKK
jgi:outer membrane protein assembly factor BamD